MIPLSARAEAEFGLAVTKRSGRFGPDALLVLAHSTGFPGSFGLDLLNEGTGIGTDEAKSPISLQGRGPALLMRPLWLPSQREPGMAFWQVDNRAASLVQEQEIRSLVLSSRDWQKQAVAIIRNIDASFSHTVLSADMACGETLRMPRLKLDLATSLQTRIGDCSPAALAILDALARRRRAVFGLESFANRTQFLQAFADVVAMLPPLLRANITAAAGFTKPAANILVQWVDGHVAPPNPGPLAALVQKLGPLRSVSEAGRLLFGDEPNGQTPDLLEAGSASTDDAVRSLFSAVLSRPLRSVDAAPLPADITNMSTELARAVASHLDQLFAGHGDCNETSSPWPYHLDHTILALWDERPESAIDAPSLADSVSAIEEILALSRHAAHRLHWTSGLTALTRRTIAALRKLIINGSSDRCMDATLLRVIARSPHCVRILAAMIKAGDRQTRARFAGAISATAGISCALDAVRLRVNGRLLDNEQPAAKVSVVAPHWYRLPQSSVLQMAAG